jgi:hypothetical protein
MTGYTKSETMLNQAIVNRSLHVDQIKKLANMWEHNMFDVNDATYPLANRKAYYKAQAKIGKILNKLVEQDQATLICVLMDDLIGELFNAQYLDSKTTWMTGDTLLTQYTTDDGVVHDITRHIHPRDWEPKET